MRCGLKTITKQSNLNKIQTFKINPTYINACSNAPHYISNFTLHADLKFKTVRAEAIKFYKCFHNKLTSHPNPYIKFNHLYNSLKSFATAENKLA